MKKNICIASLLCGLAVLATSCTSDAGEPQFATDDFSSILYWEDNGEVEVNFYNVNKDVVYTTAIGKGGTNPAISRNAKLVVYTQEEMDAYNKVNGTEYVLLPANLYDFTENYTFGAQNNKQNVAVTLKAGIGAVDRNIQYALPVLLTSDSYAVKQMKNLIVLKPTVITPKVSLDAIGKQEPVKFSMHETNPEVTVSVPLKLNGNNNGWEFSVKCETDQEILKSLVEQYVSETGSNYRVLPSGNYEIPDVVFSGTESKKELNVTVKRTGLSAGEYLLPVILKEVTGMPFDTDKSICFIPVLIDNQIRIPAEDIYANNSQDAGTAKTLVDGKIEAGWQSMWAVASDKKPASLPGDKKYGVYIDINNIKAITQAMRLKITAKGDNNYPKHVKIYTKASDGEVWKEVLDIPEAYPNFGQKPSCETASVSTGKISAMRISLLTNKSNGDLTNIKYTSESGGWAWIGPNVGLAEIELWGY